MRLLKRQTLRRIGACILALALFVGGLYQYAQAAPPYKMVVRGPGINGDLVIWLAADQSALWTMHSGLLSEEQVAAPDPSGPAYEITWYFGQCWLNKTPCNTDPKLFTTHKTRYVFDTHADRGALNHVSVPVWLENALGASSHWYRTSSEFDKTFQMLLSQVRMPESLTRAAMAACPVTLPNDDLWVDSSVGGKIVADPSFVSPSGSIHWKMGWDRPVRGKLIVTGRRLDAPAPPLQTRIPDGYGDSGFQPVGYTFPSEGCWEITGRVGNVILTFVNLVVKVPFYPLWSTRLLDTLDRPLTVDWDVFDLPKSIRRIYRSVNGEEVSIETTQGIREDPTPYPDTAMQKATVNGQPAVCIEGAWDSQQKWDSEARAGALEWAERKFGKDFSYRISYTGLKLSCDDLLRIASS